jgi:ubiquinone/menaquinone biosynthesis C-methylase UbiE
MTDDTRERKHKASHEVIEKVSNSYLDVTYGDKSFTNYPAFLAKYLTEKYLIKKNSRLLDLGCGRGEFLRGFVKQGMDGYGIDQADTAKEICPTAQIKVVNLEDRLPFEDNYFDVVFSKSVVEHFYYPEKILAEIYRVLKPNGLVITMTPDWAYNIISFHEDFTHRTAFTLQSLNDIHKVSLFRNVTTKRFIQLPIIWQFPFLKFTTMLCRIIAPDVLKKYSKFIRFSKEIMLITTANK